MSTATIPRPSKPWGVSFKQSVPDLLGAVFTIFITFAIVAYTPLKGKLGFVVVLLLVALFVTAAISRVRRDRKAALNSISTLLVYVAGLFVILPLGSIIYEIIHRGLSGLSWGIFTTDMAVTATEAPLYEGGLLHAIVGTLYIVALASLFSVPIGILTALYLTEIKGKAAGTVRFFVQAMSGIPSIVAGLFIFAIWMIALGNQYSAIAGAMALAILMVPTVARTSEEVLKLIPNDLREAGLAMGGTQWRTVAMIVLPAAQSGLVTAVILGVARVAGETAPLLLTMGGADALNLNPFAGNSSALPFYIWKNFSMGTENAVARAWTGVLVLMIIVMIFFSLTRYLSNRKGQVK
jgi:phosphate transport system permease protein